MKTKTVKSLFFVILTFTNINEANSCDCLEPYMEYFCENIIETQYIVMAEIVDSIDFTSRKINILEDLNNEISSNEVTLYGGDGGNCGEYLNQFSIGDTLIFALSKIDDDSYFLHGDCALHFLSYSNGNVIGQILPNVELISYVDFVANFMNCMESTSSNKRIENRTLNLYPNPCKSFFEIEINNITFDQVEVFSITGQKVLTMNNFLSNRKVIDLSKYNNGIYIVRVNSENFQLTKRIIKN